MHRMLTTKPATEWPPPRAIPEALRDEFTQHGQMPQHQTMYFAQRYSGTTAARSVWKSETVEDMKARHLRGEQIGSYGLHEENALKAASIKYSILGRDGAVIGSEWPWVEAILFAHGAGHITTIEYGTIDSRLSNHTAFTPAVFATEFLKKPITFDFVASVSSLEHSGLGRYGDSLNPRGDIDASQEVYCMLKPGGLFFISLPYAAQSDLVWNAHRHYGPERMALFAEQYDEIEYFGQRWKGQGVFVLQKPLVPGETNGSRIK
jgi:hypothetical protein